MGREIARFDAPAGGAGIICANAIGEPVPRSARQITETFPIGTEYTYMYHISYTCVYNLEIK